MDWLIERSWHSKTLMRTTRLLVLEYIDNRGYWQPYQLLPRLLSRVLPNKRTSAGLITTLLDVLPPVFSLLTRFGSLAAASDRLLLACLASLAALVLSVSPSLRTRLSSHLARYPSSLFPSFASCTPPTLLFLFLLFVGVALSLSLSLSLSHTHTHTLSLSRWFGSNTRPVTRSSPCLLVGLLASSR